MLASSEITALQTSCWSSSKRITILHSVLTSSWGKAMDLSNLLTEKRPGEQSTRCPISSFRAKELRSGNRSRKTNSRKETDSDQVLLEGEMKEILLPVEEMIVFSPEAERRDTEEDNKEVGGRLSILTIPETLHQPEETTEAEGVATEDPEELIHINREVLTVTKDTHSTR